MLKEFKQFISRGNVIDLAVGVIMGGAFGKIVSSLVNDVVMPTLSGVLNIINFKQLKYVIVEASEGKDAISINYGMFIQNVVDFLIISFSIFLMIKAVNKLKRKEEDNKKDKKSALTKDQELLIEIRDLLKK